MSSEYKDSAGYNRYRDDEDDQNLWKDTVYNRWFIYRPYKSTAPAGGRGGYNQEYLPGEQGGADLIETGVRPYVGGGGKGVSYVQQMRRTTDKSVFNVQLQQQSEMKKPYGNTEGYPEMEYWHPFDMGMPTLPWWPGRPGHPGPFPEGPIGNPLTPGDCALYIFGQTMLRQCGKEYNIRPIYGRFFSDIRLEKTAYGLAEITKWNRNGATILAAKADNSPTWVKQPLWVKYNDGSECDYVIDNVCKHDEPPIVEPEPPTPCCDATPDAFTDNGSSTTIAGGGSASLEVTGGCPTYTWTISSGTGYTLDQETTIPLTNTLTCASGTCGVEFSATVTVHVVDYCGSSVDLKLRNTDGQWTQVGAAEGCTPSYNFNPQCGVQAINKEYIDGFERWYVQSVQVASWGSCSNLARTWDGSSGNPEPPCGLPAPCGTDMGIDCSCGYSPFAWRFYYYTWGC